MPALFSIPIFSFPRVICNFRATAFPEPLIGNFMASVYRRCEIPFDPYFIALVGFEEGMYNIIRLMEVKKKKKLFNNEGKFSSIVPF